jgi:hypothetical protein
MIFKALSAIKIYTEFEQINNSLINSLNGVINEIDKEIDLYNIYNDLDWRILTVRDQVIRKT